MKEDSSAFLREAPLRRARRRAEAELRGDNSSLTWLTEHPILWLRALTAIEEDINDQLAKARTDLAGLKPKSGEHASREYLTAKHEQDERKAGRLHFKRIVSSRKAEVVTMLGAEPLTLTGDVVRGLSEAVAALDEDDVESVRAMLMHWIHKLTDQGNPELT